MISKRIQTLTANKKPSKSSKQKTKPAAEKTTDPFHNTIHCSKCGKKMFEVDAFPGRKCLACHEKSWRPGTAEDLAKQFRTGFVSRPRNK